MREEVVRKLRGREQNPRPELALGEPFSERNFYGAGLAKNQKIRRLGCSLRA